MNNFQIKNNIYSVRMGNFSLPQFQMFGVIMVIVGVYLLFILNYFFLFLLPVGLALITAKVGIQIDLKLKVHREYISIFGFLFGKWHAIPAIEYVTVFIEHYSQRGSVSSIDSANQFEKVKVSLIATNKERLDAGLFEKNEKGIEAGKVLAKHFETKLLDYTSLNPNWVEI